MNKPKLAMNTEPLTSRGGEGALKRSTARASHSAGCASAATAGIFTIQRLQAQGTDGVATTGAKSTFLVQTAP